MPVIFLNIFRVPLFIIRGGSTRGGVHNDNVRAGEVEILKEWYRILKFEGILRVSVPNFAAVVEEYLVSKNLNTLMSFLHGGHKYNEDYHFQSFDFKRLSDILKSIGFRDIETYDWREFLPPNYDDYSRAYLPHMDFEHGRLMSLNVVAIK